METKTMENLTEFVNWFKNNITDKDYLIKVDRKGVTIINRVFPDSYGMVDLYKVTRYCMEKSLSGEIWNGKLIIKNV